MTVLRSPLVYVGPTLSLQEVRRALPGCLVRPPIARGDLYRDRLLRGSVFVILDGVFFQQRALSPREILDVVGDGGMVIGASSLGALRAAECWPAGVRGIGSIYRLLRAGALCSDDEVAVAYDPDDPSGRSSVALVNVRHSVWRGVRERRLDAQTAERIVTAAKALFYAERHWPRILRDAGISDLDGMFARALGSHDLKRLDALRALRRVQRWCSSNPEFCVRPRRSAAPFLPWEAERERPHDALDGNPTADAFAELARWLVASGRYRRYASALDAEGGPRHRSRADGSALKHDLTRRSAAAHAEPRPFLLEFLLRHVQAAERLIAVVASSGELDAELFRARALRRLAAEAAAVGLTPSQIHRHEATERMLIEHGCESWQELLALGGSAADPAPLFRSHHEQLARALAMRERR